MRKTKIVCTLGPATNSVEILKKLINSGLDAARINFSHGTYESHGVIIDMLKQAREELKTPIPLILDTKGPEIRIKTITKDRVFLEQGSTFVLTTDEVEGDENKVSVTYKDLTEDVEKGTRILMDDGLIELCTKEVKGNDIICEVINSGFLSSNKGINIPDVYVNLPSLTEKDIADIKFGIEKGFDYIAASFIRSAQDVLKIRKILDENNGSDIHIIAKIETRDGVNNIDEILEVSDGIMVARGDLGVEIQLEEVPIVQKRLIKKANKIGKPVITATQMLESMVVNPRPTRAEANDVANAIFDGSDAIMLSGETAKGNYPIESVSMMNRIALETEKAINYKKRKPGEYEDIHKTVTNAISYATFAAATDLNCACIISITSSGFSARMVSRFRPSCPILAVTEDERVLRKLNLTWGCKAVLKKDFDNKGKKDIFEESLQIAEKLGFAKVGDSVAIVAGVPVGTAGTTNTLRIEIVGNILAKGKCDISNRILTGKVSILKSGCEQETYVEKGDIIVTNKTNDQMLPMIRMASALVVGMGSADDASHVHAKTVAKTLGIPIIICYEKVEDLIPNGILITLDMNKGYIFNGIRIGKK